MQTSTPKLAGVFSVLYESSVSFMDGRGNLVQFEPRQFGRDITFLRISVNTRQKAWLDKVRARGEMLAGSYRVIDGDSAFQKQVKFEKISRYPDL